MLRPRLRLTGLRHAQNTPRIKRKRTLFMEPLEDRLAPAGDFGFALNMGGTGFDRGVAVATDGAGNAYVAGLFNNTATFAPGVTLSAVTSTGPDIFLAKVEHNGTLDWVKQIGTTNWDEPTDVTVDSSGSIYLAGYTNGNQGFITRYNSAGTALWSQTLGAIPNAIAVDGSGNIYMTGSFGGTVNLNPKVNPPDSHTAAGGNPNIFLEKIDASGNDLWSRTYGNASGNNGVDLAVDGSGNVYATGLYRGTVNFNPTGTAVNLTAPATGSDCDIYVLKVDTNGTFDWVGNLGGTGTNEPGGITVDSAGNVYTTGFFQNSGNFDPGGGTKTLTSVGGWDIYLERIDTNGHVVWANSFGSTGVDEGWDVALLGSSVYLSGNYTGTVDFDPGSGVNSLTGSSNGNAVVARYEQATGALDWARSQGSSGLENGFGVALDASGNVFTTGQFAGTAEDFDPSPSSTFNLATTGTNDLNAYLSMLTQQAPTASNDTFAVSKSTPLVAAAPGVLANDTDPQNLPLTAVLVTGPSHGTLSLNADGSFTYTPTGAYLGADSFTYRANNGTFVSNIATASLNVSGPDDAPVASDDSYSTNENTKLTIAAPGLLGNDSDPNSDPITAVLATGPSHGTLTLNSNGSFSYQPTTNFFGTDTFTYQASDGQLQSAAATVTITVNHVNQPPVAVNDSYAVSKNTALTVPAASGILANDSDPDPGQTITAILVAQPTHGTLSFNADGSFSYTPSNNFLGTDTFTYKDTDGSLSSNVATVTLTVSGPDDAPVAVNDFYVANENTSVNAGSGVAGVLGNDSDPNGPTTLTAVNPTQPAHGTLTFRADGSFTYAPNPGYFGSDSFTYQASDGTLPSAPATVSITVKQFIYTPVAATETLTTPENTTLSMPAPGLLGNDTDQNGLPLTPVISSTTAHGTLTVKPDGSLTYVPNTYFWGNDTFTYYVTDGQASSLQVTDTIIVAHVNQAPIAVNDTFATGENTALSVGATATSLTMTSQPGDFVGQGLSYNFTPGNSIMSARVLSGGSFANTVEIRVVSPTGENWSLDFAAPDHARLVAGTYNNATRWPFQAAGVPGLDVSGDSRGSNQLTGQFTVKQAIYDSQGNIIAFGASFVQYGDGSTASLSGQVLYRSSWDKPQGYLFNDNDPDNDQITATLTAGTHHGALSFNTDGSFTYTPNPGFFGTDSFSYQDSDGKLTSGIATVSIIVENPPVAQNDSYGLSKNTALSVPVASGILSNDSDPDAGQSLSAVLVTQPAHGTLSLGADGSFTYTPANNFLGTDTFTYQANDGILPSNTATVTLTISGPNDPPVAVNDSYNVNENATLTVSTSAAGVLGNDTDPNSQPLTAVNATQPAHGTLTFNTDGSFTYTPNQGYFGTDAFGYQASDGTLLSNVATVSITVIPPYSPPTAVADTYTTAENVTLQVPAPGILGNDSDPNGLSITPFIVGTTLHGTLAVNPDGSFTYVPNTNFWGTERFSYYVSDGKAAFSNTVVDTINVTHVNQPPVAVNDSYTIPENSSLTTGPTVTSVTMTSQSGDYVGAGRSYNFTPTNSTITATVRSGGVYTNTVEVDVSTTNGEFWTLDFAAPNQARLVPGTYNNATRWPFQAGGVPGLDVSGDGRGANTLTGQFTVTQALYDAQGNIIAFDASFTQYADGSTAALTGQVLYRSSFDKPEGYLFNDSDPDNDPLTGSLVAGPSNGTLTFNNDGSFTYTPNPGFTGNDFFTYQDSDGTLTSSVATVSILVDDPPVAQGDSYAATKNTTLTVPAASGVLINDSDPNAGQSLSAVLVTQPAHGTLSLAADGSFIYTPASNFLGPDSFTYKASDSLLSSNVATVTLTVTGADDPPVAANDSYSANENATLTISTGATGVLGNDTDLNAQLLTALKVTSPAHGTLTLHADGTLSYVPSQGFFGTDSFTYQASDGTLLSNVANVTITVNQVFFPPVAAPESFTTPENTTLSLPAPGILGNDSDPNGLPITPVVLLRPAHGTLAVNTDGSFTYVPNTNFWGTDSFKYIDNDGKASSPLITDTITVAHVNQAPNAVNDAFATGENSPLTTAASVTSVTMTSQPGDFIGQGLSYNFTPSNSSITAQTLTGSFQNVIQINVSNSSGQFWTLDFAAPNYERLLPGTYFNATRYPFEMAGAPGLSVSGDGRGSNTLTGQFTVTQALYDIQGNIIAFAASFVQHSEGANPALTGQVLYRSSSAKPEGVLFNDTDPDNDPITATLVSGPSHGTLAFNNDGSFTYTPNAGFHGIDTFSYQDSDGVLSSNVATVSITVGPALAAIANQTVPASVHHLVVTLPGSDADGDPLTFSAQLTSWAYELDQTLGLTSNGNYSLNWGGRNEKWLQGAGGLQYFILPDGSLYQWSGVGKANGPLVAQLDPSYYNDPTTLWNAVPGTVPATASVSGNVLTVDSNVGYIGTFAVLATVSDGSVSDSKWFTVTVLDNAPVLAPVPNQTIPTTSLTKNITLSATDADGDPLTFSAVETTLAWDLRQRFGLFTDGNYSLNWGGLNEKWIRGAGGQQFFILPDGSFYQWSGTGKANGTLLAQLDPSFYTDPTLLTNAQNTAAPGTVSLSGNVLTITANSGFVGSFAVEASVSDGILSTSQSFIVTVTDNAPVLAAVPNQSIPAKQGSLNVTLSATDADNDPITYSAIGTSLGYELDQRLGLFSDGNYSTNWGGLNEKWIRGSGGLQYFILPDGSFYQWSGVGKANGTLVAQLDPSYYNDPTTLTNATIGSVPATVSLSNNVITISINPGYVGTFAIKASASDGILADTKWFTVTATDNPPVLSSIPDQTIPGSQQTTNITLNATDADNDPLTFSAVATTLAYELDQQLGLFTDGNYSLNWGGRNEKWINGSGGLQYFILPDGSLYQWSGTGGANGPLIAQLDPSYYNDPTTLTNAVPGSIPVTVSVSGNTLTITNTSNYVGTFAIKVTVSDGALTDSKWFVVTVTG